MKKAAPQNKQSSPTQAQLTAKHYTAAMLAALPAILSGFITLALIAWVLGVFA